MTTLTKTTTLLLAALALACSVSAQAQPRRGRVIVVPQSYIYAPFRYDPFWGPYYPYSAYPFAAGRVADVRVHVVPKQTEVFVDGYYAGTASDFDGVFKRLHTTPGGHAITLHLEGYRTVTRSIYASPDASFKIQDAMSKLAAGEISAPPPLPARPLRPATRPPAGTQNEG